MRAVFHFCAALAFMAGAAFSQEISLAFPVDCTLGSDCFIQKYVDRDPTDGYSDFGCGSLSSDEHRGTDIALHDLAAMEQGIAVRAAAPGTVKATRDGMADISVRDPNAPDVSNRNCGNAVILTHSDGWETWYCHLKRGSVLVKTDDVVQSGETIGQIGLSGLTEYPHLHLTVRHNDQVIDPFQLDDANTCGATTKRLWAEDIPYEGGGLINVGFSDAIPEFDAIKSGDAAAIRLWRGSDAMVLWAHIFGGQIGDEVHFDVRNRRGAIFNQVSTLNRDQARLFRAVGKLRPDTGWRPGTYTGEVTLFRKGDLIGNHSIEIIVDP